MAFWSDPSLDPKRQYKFKVTFGYLNSNGATGTESTYLAQYADRPVYVIADGTKVDYLDKQFHFPGKITWNPVKIRFVDATGPGTVNVSKRSYEFLNTAGWVNPQNAGPQTGPSNMKTISKDRSVTATRDVKVEVLNSEGLAIDTWVLRNAFITTVALNNLDYSADGILTAEYNFRFDWADFTGR